MLPVLPSTTLHPISQKCCLQQRSILSLRSVLPVLPSTTLHLISLRHVASVAVSYTPPHFSDVLPALPLTTLQPISQKRCLCCLQNSSSVGLSWWQPLSFQRRSFRVSFFYSFSLQAVAGVMPLALCLQAMSQAPQHFISFKRQARNVRNCKLGCGFLCVLLRTFSIAGGPCARQRTSLLWISSVPQTWRWHCLSVFYSTCLFDAWFSWSKDWFFG